MIVKRRGRLSNNNGFCHELVVTGLGATCEGANRKSGKPSFIDSDERTRFCNEFVLSTWDKGRRGKRGLVDKEAGM